MLPIVFKLIYKITLWYLERKCQNKTRDLIIYIRTTLAHKIWMNCQNVVAIYKTQEFPNMQSNFQSASGKWTGGVTHTESCQRRKRQAESSSLQQTKKWHHICRQHRRKLKTSIFYREKKGQNRRFWSSVWTAKYLGCYSYFHLNVKSLSVEVRVFHASHIFMSFWLLFIKAKGEKLSKSWCFFFSFASQNPLEANVSGGMSIEIMRWGGFGNPKWQWPMLTVILQPDPTI